MPHTTDPNKKDLDAFFMREALKEAEKARKKDEVPIGAIIVRNAKIISRGHNKREEGDPTAHAELIAIKKAASAIDGWRLTDTTLYVTLEPCLMCMGAIINSRIPRLIFAAFDPKAGACGSLYDLSNDKRLNHRVEVTSNVCVEEASAMLKDFFKKLRAKKKTKVS